MEKDKSQSSSLTDWKFWLGLLLSGIFLFLAIRNVDLNKTWQAIRCANPAFLICAALLQIIHYMFRTLRWGILLRPLKETGFINRFHSTIIGFAANCVLPARLGEFVRANFLGQSEKISKSSVFGTIVVERFFDGFTLLLILVIGLVGTTFPEEWQKIALKLRSTGILLFAGYILVIIMLWTFKYKSRFFLGLINRLLFFLSDKYRDKILDIIQNFSLGLIVIDTPAGWLKAVLYSVVLWSIPLYQIQLVEYALGIHLPFIAAFIILTMGALGVIIPSSPGFIGTYHLAVQYGFIFYNINKAEALSGAIILHAVFFFPTILFGLISFFLMQGHFNETGNTWASNHKL